MAASGAGRQWATVRSMVMAWVLTLPAAILMSGTLYCVLRQVMWIFRDLPHNIPG